MSAPPDRYQATILLPGRFEEGRFASPYLPAGFEVRLSRFALKYPQKLMGEGLFTVWPRTNIAGEIVSLLLINRFKETPPDAAVVHVQGILLGATTTILTILIKSKNEKQKPFRISLARAPELTAPLELNKPHRVEGRIEGLQLIAERVWPLEWLEAPKSQKKPAPPPASKKPAPPPVSKKPAPPPVSKKPAPPSAPKRPAPAPPAQEPAELLPALPKGRQIGIVGNGPYYLVLSPPAIKTWWLKVEMMLPHLPRRYTVRSYENGSMAVVTDDLEALRSWYRRVLAS